MNQRVARLANQIREILSEFLVRGEIKDPRVRAAGILTFTHVRLTGDLREATALFMAHGADAAALEQAKEGLNSAAGYLRRQLGREVQLRVIPTLTFEIDQVFEQEEKVDQLLAAIQAEKKPT